MANQIKLPRIGGRTSWSDAVHATLDVDVAAAVAFFRSSLGEEWPGWSEGRPLANAFFTAFQIGPKECVRFHRMIGALDGTANLDLLVKDLGNVSWTDYVAAVMAFEFCSRLHTAGHRVELVKRDDLRRPDARVMVAGGWVTVEFKGLHDSDDQEPWDPFVDRVVSGLAEHAVGLDAFEIDFAQGALERPDSVIDALIAVHRSRNCDFEDLPSGAGRARFANGKGTFTIPIVEHDDLVRVEKRLLDRDGKWSRQLATVTGATLLVAKSKYIFGAFGHRYVLGRAAEVSSRLVPVLQLRPEIGAILIYEEPTLGPPPPFSAEAAGATVTVGTSEGGHSRVAILLPNPTAKVPLTKDEIGPLIGSRMRW